MSEDLLTSRTLPVPCSCCMAACRSPSVTCGNSSTPLWMRKHLKPATPARIMGRSSSYNCASVICGCVWSNSVLIQKMCSFGPGWFAVPGCRGSHHPRRLCPQNTSLSPPAASCGNEPVWWLEECCFWFKKNNNNPPLYVKSISGVILLLTLNTEWTMKHIHFFILW